MEKKLGFIRVASAIPVVEVANPKLNADRIIALIEQAAKENVKIVCFPELCLTGYTCADLFYQRTLIDETEVQLERVNKAACENGIFAIVGAPVYRNGKLYNAAYVAGAENDMTSNLEVYKNYLPSNNEFYEKRWFTPGFGENKKVFEVDGIKFGIEICEDLWMPSSPSDSICLDGAEIIFNLSASDELIGKEAYRRQLVKQKSATNACAYVYTAAGFGESSTDLVFSGTAIIAENGSLIATSERFSFKDQLIVADIDVQRLQADRLRNSAFIIGNQNPNKSDHEVVRLNKKIYAEPSEVTRTFAPHPFVPPEDEMKTRCNEIFSIQVGGLATRLYHTGIKHTVVGISGGLDSTLALLVTVKTFDKLGIPRKNIVGITMPGFGTTGRTYNNSIHMMQSLGITIKEIDIKPACLQHLKDIEHDLSVLDVSYENTQARERTQILMDYANKMGAIVIGTGDLSELVLGWCTYNGDHMSMYAVNTSIPKTLVKYLVKYVALYEMDEAAKETLLDVCDTPISPELLPADDKGEIAQKTEDFVGPYELHDFFIYYTLRFGFSPTKIFFMAQKAFAGKYDDATILKWMRTFYWRFFTQQFKRSCMPDGPKVGSVNLSPRGDWRMPSDANSKIWIEEVDRLIELAMKNAK
ncbi:MAG: NAD(+) synthase [Paludibacteraceae bacterium]|nr:NAD(+) synthase [Paludibacteraceae bacterium]